MLASERQALAARVARADALRAREAQERERLAVEAAAIDRAVRKQREAEWLASLPLRRRVFEHAQALRPVGFALVGITLVLAVVAAATGAMGQASSVVGIAGGGYLVLAGIVALWHRRRAAQPSAEQLDRLREQLTRIESVLGDR